jgi:putative MFS transporter
MAATPQLAGNIAGRLERLPISRFHYVAFTVIGLAMFFDGYDLTITGVVLPSLARLHWTDPGRTPLFISIPLFAAAFGSMAAGFLGDRFGRRLMFRCNVLVYSIGSLLCGLSTSFEMLLVLRTITMFAIGTQIVTGYAYMNELTPGARRGRFQSAVALLVNGGLPVGALLAYLVVPHLPIELGWRVLFVISVIPAFVVFIAQGILPESPRWLVSVGRDAQAEAVMLAIEAKVGGVLAAPRALPPPERDLGWKELLAGPYRSRFALAVVFNVCHLVAIFVLSSWLPSILMSRGLGLANAFSFAAISFAGGFIGPIIAMAIADRLERRTQVAGAALVCAVSGILYSQQTTAVGLMGLGLVLVGGIFFISAVGFATYLPEILPTGVRLRGMGAAAFVGRIASAVSPFVVAAVLATVQNPFIVIAGVGGLYVLMAAMVLLAGPRTSGQPLEILEQRAMAAREAAGLRLPT